MRVTLVNHASVIIEAGDVVMWTDPWLFGRAFNESWALAPEPPLDLVESWLPRITHLYVSHEHPDHFHIPTLRWLPDTFKRRVSVLFQRLHSSKMPDAFRRLGFTDVRTFRHREIAELSTGVRFYMFQEAPLDSACGLIDDQGRVVMNMNDCEPSPRDREWIRKDLGGSVDVLLNQFSIATYDGRENAAEIAPRHASRLLERMALDHRGVGAKVTIPIASFMYFCCEDNAYLNGYRNSIQATKDAFTRAGLELVVLRPFDSYQPGDTHDNQPALEYYHRLEETALVPDPLQSTTREAIESASAPFFDDLYAHYPALLLRRIGSFRVWIPDLGVRYLLDFRARTMVADGETPGEWDVRMNSQPLLFALTQPYGFQTLSISGRFVIRSGERRFLLLRVVTGLRNAEIFLKVRDLVSRPFATFVARNFVALSTQVLSNLRQILRFVN
jgi:hypothetical protein